MYAKKKCGGDAVLVRELCGRRCVGATNRHRTDRKIDAAAGSHRLLTRTTKNADVEIAVVVLSLEIYENLII